MINKLSHDNILKQINKNLGITLQDKKSVRKYFKHITNVELEIIKSKRFLVNYSYNILNMSYLYLCKINCEKHSLIITDNSIIKTEIYFTDNNIDLYENGGTLFEGKIINKLFIINDFYNNNYIINNLLEKVGYLNSIFINNYIYDEFKDEYKLICEYFCEYNYIKSYSLGNYIPEIKKYISGLIFRDIYPIGMAQNYMNYLFIYSYQEKGNLKLEEIKGKIQENVINAKKNKQDLHESLLNQILIMKIQKTQESDIYEIYYNNKYINIADVPDLKTSIFLRNIFKKEKKGFLYFKCSYNEKNQRWYPFELNRGAVN